MNNITHFFSDYIQFVFLGKIQSNRPIIDMDEADIVPSDKEPSPPREYSNEKQTKLKLIVQINRLLMVICGLSFIFIFIYPFIYPDKVVPDLIQNAFLTTSGYFCGVSGAFFQINQTRNS